MTEALALFGPGDLADWSGDVLRRITRDGPALVLSFGVVPMGREYVAQLRQLAVAHLEALGLPFVALDAEDRDHLDDHRHVRLLDGAGFVYLQGGSPGYLAATLRGSAFLDEARRSGVPWAVTSGGTMAAGRRYVDTTVAPMATGEGLGLRPHTFAAHWDTFEDRFPGYRQAYEAAAGDGVLVAVDEDAAVVHDGRGWTVHGNGHVHVHVRAGGGAWSRFVAGEALPPLATGD